ncbi:LOW QUALITY PROTEIN: NACHT, LRR and PYD domains-containing protein 12-like [Mastacembelus armatus]|uniref:LOW QUALITY PROTEIN: NACHT, LRR and PYD domains-containing protein 12-like n=1 Tax=Mastacembelus armatus TaxID=205130 RepID=UPI000E462FAA|nr:LOW QUALITY PROTEIN: NACHT, LRR and PYD domains-containing protein 12-like [Mastacembelus armatus]
MASVPELLLETLEELVDKLYSNVLKGFPHIPKSRIDGAGRLCTVDLLVQTYGYDGAVTVTADILMRMKLKLWAETLTKKYSEDISNQVSKGIDHHAVQEKLKSSLREKYQNIYEGNADEGDTVYLNKIYTELHVIEGACGGFSEECEVRQQRTNHVRTEETSIKAGDIFKPRHRQDKRIRTVLTQGIPGVGKTVCTQKFILSWAEGEENQDITFLFPLPFRELNPNIGEKDYSLMQLLHQFFPEIKSLEILGTECKVLFIFDGLDETLLPLNFKLNKVLRDETEPASLDVLITNLITGDLLRNALIWITSRPAAASRISRKYIHQWTEVKGFANEQKEEYFKKHLRDDNLAMRIINHVKSSRSLYIMCQIPVFCWITVTVMKKMLHNNETGGMTNTLTEMYAYLLLCQIDRMKEGHYPMESDSVVLKLAELAFRQLEKGKLIFYEADLKECGMDVKEATIYSGVCTEVFMVERRRRREVFSFVHLTIQEFLAAVYAHHSYMQRKDNVLLGYLKRLSTKWLPRSVFSFHKTAIEKALERQDGHWDLFLRFLLGLSLKSNQELLGRILHLEAEEEEDVARTIQFIKEKMKEEPEAKLNLFHCLSELKEESLVQEIQSFVSSGRLRAKTLSPVQWSALTFELMTSEATEEEFDLKKYIRSEEGVLKLLTVITSSTCALLNNCNLTENCCEVLASALSSTSSHLTKLDLSQNSLKDAGVTLLSVGLQSTHCKLKSLRLHKCKLEGDCFGVLAVAISTASTQLRELDLSANEFQEAGVKVLCAGLCSPHCKLETLRLNHCKLQDRSCTDLASVLSAGSSNLKNLDLSNNNLNNSGVSLLTPGLRSPHCRLETLSLSWCRLTHKCCRYIGAVLSSDSAHLRELDLSGNNLQGPGIQLLCAGLTSPHSNLKTLRLNDCSLQKCCAEFASVLNSNSSNLKELILSGNDLQDSEVKVLSVGLASQYCKLKTIKLSFCGVTKKGCTYLSSALSSNPSHLRELDLSYNYLEDSGVKLLSVHVDNPLCKLEKLRVEYNAECYLKSTLKNYACPLTFDTNTAAKSLFLYTGGKQVARVRETQQYPDHPERFESVSQVLCHQGLTQRHYWEVEWRGRWVDVAVAMRGIRRRAGSHLCGFGYTDQSWSLYCSDDHYSAHHDHQSLEIPAPPSHSHRVGVYLDWPGGTLSFYSVLSGTLSHLHTFNSTFAEPLYPGFGMEEDDCSVIICTAEDMPELISRSASAERIDEF